MFDVNQSSTTLSLVYPVARLPPLARRCRRPVPFSKLTTLEDLLAFLRFTAAEDMSILGGSMLVELSEALYPVALGRNPLLIIPVNSDEPLLLIIPLNSDEHPLLIILREQMKPVDYPVTADDTQTHTFSDDYIWDSIPLDLRYPWLQLIGSMTWTSRLKRTEGETMERRTLLMVDDGQPIPFALEKQWRFSFHR
ncbi:hypothetical protein C8F04DRAFT_1134046, partial [Mycena alexandri]